MKFSETIGHKEEIGKLISMVEGGRLPHAILLHGPSGIGKTNVARAFIQYLNCTDRSGGDSCGKCPACLQTSKLNNPDVHYIFPLIKNARHPNGLLDEYADDWKEFITEHPYMPYEKWLEKIAAGNSQPLIPKMVSEEILRLSALSNYGAGYKIFLIWLPEKMNADSANRLLKVIEEPHPDTLFLLVSNDPGSIISTIRSRLQHVEFKPLPDEEIAAYLCSRGKSYEEAATLAKIAGGNVNKMVALIDENGEMEEFREIFVGMMRAAYARKMPELKELADSISAQGRERSIRLLTYFGRMLRESFISNLQCNPLKAMTAEEAQFVERFGPFINAANIEELLGQVDRARIDIAGNANQKIVWFDFMIELTRLIRTKGMAAARQQQQ